MFDLKKTVSPKHERVRGGGGGEENQRQSDAAGIGHGPETAPIAG